MLRQILSAPDAVDGAQNICEELHLSQRRKECPCLGGCQRGAGQPCPHVRPLLIVTMTTSDIAGWGQESHSKKLLGSRSSSSIAFSLFSPLDPPVDMRHKLSMYLCRDSFLLAANSFGPAAYL